MKLVKEEHEWQKVAKELAAEELKLMSYDKTLFDTLGTVNGQRILDYGCGPGVLASVLLRLGAGIKGFDISKDMRQKCGEKIGTDRLYVTVGDIPVEYFDVVICNLVMCIVPEDEVAHISRNIRNALNVNGHAYVGFCNPKIYDVSESRLDFRYQTGSPYEENHSYKKLKKEGCYKIIELHRPIEWYQKVFESSGLSVEDMIFTPEYELNGKKIKDFILFKLSKK